MRYNKHHNLKKIVTTSGVLISFLTITFFVNASEVSHGEVQAAIRSADFACNQVVSLKSDGDNIWLVKCNSGKYRVMRDKKGKFTVSKIK